MWLVANSKEDFNALLLLEAVLLQHIGERNSALVDDSVSASLILQLTILLHVYLFRTKKKWRSLGGS